MSSVLLDEKDYGAKAVYIHGSLASWQPFDTQSVSDPFARTLCDCTTCYGGGISDRLRCIHINICKL
jgi:heptaprenylglyceryl phosphate synthase